MLLKYASDPPLRITQFPDLKHNAETSAVTLGLLSYIIPIIPIGIVTLFILRPFGLFHLLNSTSTGFFILITVLIDLIIDFILSEFKESLFIKFSFNFFDFANLISFLFSNIIFCLFLFIKLQKSFNTLFFFF